MPKYHERICITCSDGSSGFSSDSCFGLDLPNSFLIRFIPEPFASGPSRPAPVHSGQEMMEMESRHGQHRRHRYHHHRWCPGYIDTPIHGVPVFCLSDIASDRLLYLEVGHGVCWQGMYQDCFN